MTCRANESGEDGQRDFGRRHASEVQAHGGLDLGDDVLAHPFRPQAVKVVTRVAAAAHQADELRVPRH